MKLSGIRKGDKIECVVRGRRFHAVVTAAPINGTVAIQPPRGINYYNVAARQVVGRPQRWDPYQALRCKDRP